MTREEGIDIDWEQVLDRETVVGLQELESHGSGMAGLVALFRRDADERLEELEGAVQRGDREMIARVVHSIKGSSAMMGAVGPADVCRRIERLVTGGDLAEVPLGVAQLRSELERAHTALGVVFPPDQPPAT